MHGGEQWVNLKTKFMQEIERDPSFRLDDIHDLSKDQVRPLALKHTSPFKLGLSHDLRRGM